MYYIVFGLLYAVSLLPWRILYVLSDLAYIIIYYFIGYRKEVINDNLLYSFPEKTEEERKLIAKKFYKCFCDNWIETLKLMSVSKKTWKNVPVAIFLFYMNSIKQGKRYREILDIFLIGRS
jgi:KDO2-lipid IV(A) lauroyltransferase